MSTVCAPSQLCWFFWERGGYTEMSGTGTRHSFLVEHPQQHLLKMRVHTSRYFLLIQFNSALQISAAEIQEYFWFLTERIPWIVSRLVNRCNSWKNTTGLDLSTPPLSLDIGLEQWSFKFCFWIFCLSVSEALIFFILLKHFFLLRRLRW